MTGIEMKRRNGGGVGKGRLEREREMGYNTEKVGWLEQHGYP